ncbi:MAG: DUF2382 domain-containing protein, partial [Chloroflexi bacterium]|nr:DUF2382 domain-containing protein [Chloroflexota bacterium]
MRDTIVMLFHTNDAAQAFVVRLKAQKFAGDDIMVVGPDDLPQFGRGEHAAGGGILDRIASFFSGEDEGERAEQRYATLGDYLESRGLDRAEADHFESEVRAGNYMAAVKAGDRAAEVEQLAHGGTAASDRGAVAGAGGVAVAAAAAGAEVIGEREHAEARGDTGGEIAEKRDQAPEMRETAAPTTGETIAGKSLQERETTPLPVEREKSVAERPAAEGDYTAGGMEQERISGEREDIPVTSERPSYESREVTLEDVTPGDSEVTEIEEVSGGGAYESGKVMR